MKLYRVTITPDALDMLNQRLAYLLFVKKSEQAYDAVETDYYDTLEELSNVAGAIQEPDEPELKSRGLRRIHFLRHSLCRSVLSISMVNVRKNYNYTLYNDYKDHHLHHMDNL